MGEAEIYQNVLYSVTAIGALLFPLLLFVPAPFGGCRIPYVFGTWLTLHYQG